MMNQQYINCNNAQIAPNNVIVPNQPQYMNYNTAVQVPQNTMNNYLASYQQQLVNAQLIQQQVNKMNFLNNMCLNMMVNQTQNLIQDLNNLHTQYQPLQQIQQPQQYPSQQQYNKPKKPQPQPQQIQPISRDNNQFSNSNSSINSSSSGSDFNSDGHVCEMKKFLRWIIYHDQIDDYAEMLCAKDLGLQIYVINQCARHSATHSACIKWSKKWNLITNNKCIESIRYVMEQQMKFKNKNKNKINSNSRDFIDGFDNLLEYNSNDSANNNRFNILNDIIFVNDMNTFLLAKEILLGETQYIGLDLECTVKHFPLDIPPKFCQILQIATSTKTIIFDLECIPNKYSQNINKNNNYVREFEELLHGIFYNPSILKIGMGFAHDLKLLRKQYPYLKCFKCIIKSYFELEKVLKFMRSKQGEIVFNINKTKESLIKTKLNKTNMKREGGLSTIVRHILNAKLSKKEQLSNWARRPLRLEQLKYAAIDAKIQIEMYIQLIQKYSQFINVNKWIADLSIYSS